MACLLPIGHVSNPSGAQPSLRHGLYGCLYRRVKLFQIPAERSRLFDSAEVTVAHKQREFQIPAERSRLFDPGVHVDDPRPREVSNPSGAQPSLRPMMLLAFLLKLERFKSQRSAAVSSTYTVDATCQVMSEVSNPSGAQPSLRRKNRTSSQRISLSFQIPAERSRLFDIELHLLRVPGDRFQIPAERSRLFDKNKDQEARSSGAEFQIPAERSRLFDLDRLAESIKEALFQIPAERSRLFDSANGHLIVRFTLFQIPAERSRLFDHCERPARIALDLCFKSQRSAAVSSTACKKHFGIPTGCFKSQRSAAVSSTAVPLV